MSGLIRIRPLLGAISLVAVVCCGAQPLAAQDQAASREALREQIRQYSELVRAMRDSLASQEQDTLQTRQIESTIIELSDAVGAITRQLSDLELEVIDNRVSLRDGRGGQVTLDVPENLSEQLSVGLSSISRMFLDQLPDTVQIGDVETGFTWSMGDHGIQFVPRKAQRDRRIIDGGLVKITDDVAVAADEDVSGDVVAVMGDAEIAGLVRGDLVVVMGDVRLAETAEVQGQIVVVLGQLERDPGAVVGDMTVIDPGGAGSRGDLGAFFRGWGALVAFQGLFIGLLLLALLLLAIVPRGRVLAVVDVASARPGACLAVGLVALVGGHAVVLGLSVLLVLTVIGIPVALVVLAALLTVDLAGIAIGAILVGRLACKRLGWACPMLWRELLVGFFLLQAIPFLASLLGVVLGSTALAATLAWLGGALKVATFAIGLGALLIGRLGVRASRSPEPAGPPRTLLDPPVR